ncbi:MAG TPA: hypothetical protein VFL38_02360 [Humibacillus xanthopallidus]|nr:hypothetical protein [Humibacillus xanthopallidus]
MLVARYAPTLLTQTISQPAMRREVDVMGLTVCLALLGALIAGSDHEPHSKFDLILIVWVTTVGLVLTHAFALMLAVWLVKDPTYTIKPALLLGVQLAMASLIALTATVVALLASSNYDRLGARMSAAVFIGLLVGMELRAHGSSPARSLAWGLVSMAAAVGLATAKWVVGS